MTPQIFLLRNEITADHQGDKKRIRVFGTLKEAQEFAEKQITICLDWVNPKELFWVKVPDAYHAESYALTFFDWYCSSDPEEDGRPEIESWLEGLFFQLEIYDVETQ